MTKPLFCTREGVESDMPFVLASWVESDRFSPAGRDAGPCHRAEHRALVQRILPRLHVAMAHAPDDPDALLGWAAYEFRSVPIVHYCYVKGGPKANARRLGIARALLAHLLDEACEYTHRPVTRGLPIPERWTYVPITYRS